MRIGLYLLLVVLLSAWGVEALYADEQLPDEMQQDVASPFGETAERPAEAKLFTNPWILLSLVGVVWLVGCFALIKRFVYWIEQGDRPKWAQLKFLGLTIVVTLVCACGFLLGNHYLVE